jgi:hypothetical protein
MYERPNCCHCKTTHVKLNDHETLPGEVHVIFTVKEVAMEDATVGALPFFPVSIFPTVHHTVSFRQATAKAT